MLNWDENDQCFTLNWRGALAHVHKRLQPGRIQLNVICEPRTGGLPHTVVEQWVDTIWEGKNNAKKFIRLLCPLNTEYGGGFVSLRALVTALTETMGTENSVQEDLTNMELEFYVEREAHDEMGGHVGTEQFTAVWKIWKRRELGFPGPPEGLDPYVVKVDSYKTNMELPSEEENEGYFPPDEDFAFQELQHHIDDALDELPEAVFDRERRMWTLGDAEYDVAVRQATR